MSPTRYLTAFIVGVGGLASLQFASGVCTETVILSSAEMGYTASAPDYTYQAPMMSHTFDISTLVPEAIHLTVDNVHGDFFRYQTINCCSY